MSSPGRLTESPDGEFFSGLPEPEIGLIERSSSRQRVLKGRSLYTEGLRVAFLYLVQFGSFKLVRHSKEGRELIVALVGPGGWFGALGAAFESMVQARALEDSVVTAIPTSAIGRALERCPELSRRLLRSLEERLRSAEIQAARLAFDSVARRLVSLLVETSDPRSGLLRFPLNQTDIANLIGSSRETVCSLLNQFRRDGLVDIRRGRIQIVDPKRLHDLN